MIKKTSMIISIFLCFMSFTVHSSRLNTGPWRFELKTTHGIVPFIINISNIKNRHQELVKEMQSRGMIHKSELKDINVEISKEFMVSKVNVVSNIEDLKSRCINCRQLFEKHQSKCKTTTVFLPFWNIH